MCRNAVDDSVIINFFHLCTRFTGGKEPDQTKQTNIRIWWVFFMERNKYTVDLSVVYSYGLSYFFGLRFLLKEQTLNS